MRDLTSLVFGKLTVIRFTEKRSSRSPIWECRCECGNYKHVQACHLISGHTKSCGCLHKEICRKKLLSYHKYLIDNKMKGSRWRGVGGLYASYVSGIKSGAKNRNLEFSVTSEYLWDLFIKQEERCVMTGLPIKMAYRTQSASLDRIDSSKGYVEGNVQWVHKDINSIKQDFSLKEFLNYCKLVVDYEKQKCA